MFRLSAFILLLVGLSFLQACSTAYEGTAIKAWDQMASGQFDEALSAYSENVKSDKDHLLRLMDEGMILRVAKSFKESNQKFFEAARIIELAGYSNITEEVATLLVNEKQKVYQGEDFEKVLVHLYLGLNFIAMRDWDAALVETRKVNEILYQMISQGQRPYKLDAFSRYLAGTLYEKDREINDAFIAYKKTSKLDKNLSKAFTTLQVDLLRTSSQMGFSDELVRFKKSFGQPAIKKFEDSLKNTAQLVFVFESGKSPQKYSSREKHSKKKRGGTLVEVLVPVSYYKSRGTSVSRAKIQLFNKGAAKVFEKTATLSSIDKIAQEHLKDRMGRAIAKALLQAGLKAGIATGIGKATDSADLGMLAGLALFAMSEADTRSWLLLPEKLQVAKLFAKPGVYDLRVEYLNKTGSLAEVEWIKNITLKKNDLHFIQRRKFY